jgi:hypothetical protein
LALTAGEKEGLTRAIVDYLAAFPPPGSSPQVLTDLTATTAATSAAADSDAPSHDKPCGESTGDAAPAGWTNLERESLGGAVALVLWACDPLDGPAVESVLVSIFLALCGADALGDTPPHGAGASGADSRGDRLGAHPSARPGPALGLLVGALPATHAPILAKILNGWPRTAAADAALQVPSFIMAEGSSECDHTLRSRFFLNRASLCSFFRENGFTKWGEEVEVRAQSVLSMSQRRIFVVVVEIRNGAQACVESMATWPLAHDEAASAADATALKGTVGPPSGSSRWASPSEAPHTGDWVALFLLALGVAKRDRPLLAAVPAAACAAAAQLRRPNARLPAVRLLARLLGGSCGPPFRPVGLLA